MGSRRGKEGEDTPDVKEEADSPYEVVCGRLKVHHCHKGLTCDQVKRLSMAARRGISVDLTCWLDDLDILCTNIISSGGQNEEKKRLTWPSDPLARI